MPSELSLVIPAYNEARRLPPYLERIRAYAHMEFPQAHEVLVVDDGSDDNLASVLGEWARAWPELAVRSLPANRGKGAAARLGMLAARGNLVLLADADGATPIEEEAKLRQAIRDGADIAVGSRCLCARPAGRTLSGKLFAGLVRGFFHLPVHDSQCGFKMFRRAAAHNLFRLAREDGFLIDVEILALAQRFHYLIGEVPVRWRDVPGSKVRWCRDGWRMLSGLVRLDCRVRSVFGADKQATKSTQSPARKPNAPYAEPLS